MLFVRSIFHGSSTVWFAKSVMSKPLSPADESTSTATLSCRGGMVTVELIMGGATGQVVLPSLAMQTRPAVDVGLMLKTTFTECVRFPLAPITVTV
jgi:hypothetical protein